MDVFPEPVHQSESTRTIIGHDILAAPSKSSFLETDSSDTVTVHVIQSKLNILVGLFFHEELFNTVNRNLGFLDVREHVTELVQWNTKEHEEGDSCEGNGWLQRLLLNVCVDKERKERDKNGDRVPDSHSQCPDHESRAQGFELSLALLINNAAKALLPSKVLDDANILQDLVGNISGDLGNFKTVDGHEVDDGSQIGLLITRIVLVVLDGFTGRLGVVGRSLLIILLHAQGSLDLVHESILCLAIFCGLGLVLKQHFVLACSSLATKSLGINITNNEGSDSDADLSTNPESLITSEDSEGALNEQIPPEVLEQMHGKRSGSLHLTRLARRFDAILPFQANCLVALPSGHCHSKEESDKSKLHKCCNLVDATDALLEESGTEEEDRDNPVEAIKESSVVPEMRASPLHDTKNESQSRKDKYVNPNNKTGNRSSMAMASFATSGELDNIDSNETGDSKFFNDLRHQLSSRGVGLDYRTTGRSFDKGQATSIDLEGVIVIRIVNLFRR
ncbi:hypothetical protein HG530_005519 [Fusarium avenaceum]|nr:hypothetical protein HG530_005519 [Fusarium avenaceum]